MATLPTARVRCAASALLSLGAAAPLLAQQTDFSIEEVVVTAQKRSESVQSVPISITALEAVFIEDAGVTNITDIIPYTPGLSGSTVGGGTPLWAIRGIATTSFASGSENSIGIFIDEAYIGRNTIAVGSFFDVERVEIVKGPQGTLFGRNASAGAINIITNKPAARNSLHLKVGAGNEGQQRYEVVGNAALNDTFALRLAALSNEHDGIQTNLFTGSDVNDRDELAARLSARYTPSDDFEALFSAQHFEFEGLTYRGPNSALEGVEFPSSFTNSIDDIPERIDAQGYDLRLTWALSDGITLTSISDYRDWSYEFAQDIDGVGFLTINFLQPDVNAETKSQEFRLSGSRGAVDWFIGASYFQEDISEIQVLDVTADTLVQLGFLPPGALPPDLVLSDRIAAVGDFSAVAVYGDIAWNVNDRFKITAGARWTEDDKDWTTSTVADLELLAPNTFGPLRGSERWTKVTPRLAVDYQVNPDVLIYANVGKGYKAGGFNSTTDGLAVQGFDPETNTAYEAGVKSTLADGRLRVNAAYYVSDYEDLQVQTIKGGLVFTANAADVDIDGLELDLVLLPPVKGLEIGANANFMNAEFKDAIITGVDVSGQKVSFAPDTTYSIYGRYEVPVGKAGDLSFFAAYNYQSKIKFDVLTALNEDSYGLWNGRIRFTSRNEKWSASLIGENIGDKAYAVIRQDPLGLGPQVVRGTPLFWRFEVDLYFGR